MMRRAEITRKNTFTAVLGDIEEARRDLKRNAVTGYVIKSFVLKAMNWKHYQIE